MIYNAGARQINNVFGWVYGTGSDERPGTHLINDPHAQALKVSLGRHVPGSLGLYQFAVSPDDLIFDSYALVVRDKALRHPARVDIQVQRVTQ
ncbi:MAG: hypothetical protein HY804_02565 [Nitrospinae bacterium]|nr:hypothetical protein [Nitrospinota bacterium]